MRLFDVEYGYRATYRLVREVRSKKLSSSKLVNLFSNSSLKRDAVLMGKLALAQPQLCVQV